MDTDVTNVEYIPPSGENIYKAACDALTYFQSVESVVPSERPHKYFFRFNDVDIVWKPSETVESLVQQYMTVVHERERAIEIRRQQEAIPDATNLEVHNEAMNTIGRHWRVFTRIGRWGRCNACPEDGRGDYYPEFCVNTDGGDHSRREDDLLSQYRAWIKSSREKINKQRQAQRDAIQ